MGNLLPGGPQVGYRADWFVLFPSGPAPSGRGISARAAGSGGAEEQLAVGQTDAPAGLGQGVRPKWVLGDEVYGWDGTGYDASLEAFFRPLMALAEYSLGEEGRMTVHNDTARWYRYIDLTRQAEAILRLTIPTAYCRKVPFRPGCVPALLRA